ncbi:MAG: lipopolysaccharide kinase InaA family protein, partial [Planctomycetia bacterium]|nr:lipopolysaccharide kinase InaA family protein [Planctomycetia bacterium]
GLPLDEYLYDSCFEASDDEPEFPGARPPEFVSVYRRRRPGSSEIVIGLARPLAVLLATLYRAGAYFSDLHPGNILLVREPEPVLYLTDLGRLTFRAPHDALLRHLVRMNNYFAPITTQTERFHFWKSLGEYHDLPIPRLEQIEKATERYRLGTYRRRDRRWRGFNKYVAHVSVGPWRGRAVTDWRDNIQRALQASPDPFAHDGAVVIKHSQSSTVAEVNWGGRWPVIIKRDNRGGFRRWFKRLVVPSRTWRGWLKGHWLLMRGVATARPVAVLRRKGGWSLDNSLLATEKLRDSVALDKWWRQSQTPRHRRRIVEQLARFVRRLHNLGISQRDLKAQNILVQMRSPDYHQLYLIDLDGLKFRRRVSHRRKVQNVMRLNVSADEVGVISRSQRLRFLRSYMRASPGGMLPSVSFRRWGVQKESVRRMRRFWQQVAEASARKWAKLAIRQREMLARRTAAGR